MRDVVCVNKSSFHKTFLKEKEEATVACGSKDKNLVWNNMKF